MSIRIKIIDFLRGLCVVWMICGHLSEWWIYEPYFESINTSTWNGFYIFDFLGAAGFLFISGMAVTISYRNKLTKSKESTDFNFKKYRLSYFIKIFLLLIISFAYNSIEAFLVEDPTKLWIWFIFQTLAFCLLFLWPILKINKYYKILFAIVFFIANEIIWNYIWQYRNLYDTPGGVLYYILYNNYTLTPFLQSFPIFIIGSFLGDITYEHIIKSQDKELLNSIFIKKITLPLVTVGLTLIIIAIFIYPEFIFADHPFPPYFDAR